MAISEEIKGDLLTSSLREYIYYILSHPIFKITYCIIRT
jgi:hypothetical protein